MVFKPVLLARYKKMNLMVSDNKKLFCDFRCTTLSKLNLQNNLFSNILCLFRKSITEYLRKTKLYFGYNLLNPVFLRIIVKLIIPASFGIALKNAFDRVHASFELLPFLSKVPKISSRYEDLNNYLQITLTVQSFMWHLCHGLYSLFLT